MIDQRASSGRTGTTSEPTGTTSGRAGTTSGMCAGISAVLGEALPGTAPHVLGWLLVEHRGPWGAGAPASLFDPVIADELARRCDNAGVRLLAVRRAAGRQVGDPDVCYAASSRPGASWMSRIPLAEVKELLDLDVAALAAGDAPARGTSVSGPVFAVCAHGRRDVCCAREGQPLRRALDAVAAEQVWETTHVGGHRFAGNLLVLPEGLMYGRVDATSAATIADAHRGGEVVTALLRGRTALPRPAQAAEWFARHETGLRGIDDVLAFDVRPGAGDDTSTVDLWPGDDAWTVDLRAGDHMLRAVVAYGRTGCARITSCGDEPADPGRWRLQRLTEVDPRT